MDEEEYAEYIRAQMWYKQNKELEEQREAQRRLKKEKEEKAQRELDKLRAEEARRIRKLEEMSSVRRQKEAQESRARYDDLWKKLSTKSAADDRPLRFTDFPWPIYPPVPYPPLSWPATSDITSSAVSHFLLSSDVGPEDASATKATLRAAVLAYHPDRFRRLVQRIPEEDMELRDRVEELGLRVSQALNELADRK
jgi:hypothetical protein